MYIDEDNFDTWMKKLSKKLEEISKDLKILVNTECVFSEDERILDNQDVALLLKTSYRSLARYRAKGILGFFKINNKPYYKVSDIREFIQRHYNKNAAERLEQELKNTQ